MNIRNYLIQVYTFLIISMIDYNNDSLFHMFWQYFFFYTQYFISVLEVRTISNALMQIETTLKIYCNIRFIIYLLLLYIRAENVSHITINKANKQFYLVDNLYIYFIRY